MAKNIPTEFESVGANRFATGEVVFASDFEAITDAQAFEFSRSAGFNSVGWAFDPPSQFTSATFTQTASANKDLSELMWASDFLRLTNLAGVLRYRIWLVIIAENLDVQLSVRDPGGADTQVTASKVGLGFGRAVAAITGFASGAGPKLFELEAKKKGAGATGSLAHVQVLEEKIISAAYLPTGR